MARVLVLAFSDLTRDTRVQRQIGWLEDAGYEVVVAAHEAPEGFGRDFIRLERATASLPQRLRTQGLRVMRRWTSAYWSVPEFRHWRDALLGRRVEAVVVNDMWGLPIAFEAAAGGPVLFDAHEYAAEEFASSVLWRLVVAPQIRAIARSHLPRLAGMTTVSGGIADLYRHDAGVDATVVVSAPEYVDLEPTPVGDPIRLVHWGLADPQRRPEVMIDAMLALDERFTLDLILIGDESYRRRLCRRCHGDPRIRFLEPVPAAKLPEVGNSYDIGIFVMEPLHANQLHVLPNKFFEFVQARLAVAIGPSPEMAAIGERYGFAVVADDWSPGAIAASLRQLSAESVADLKRRASEAAKELCAERVASTFQEVVARALADPR